MFLTSNFTGNISMETRASFLQVLGFHEALTEIPRVAPPHSMDLKDPSLTELQLLCSLSSWKMKTILNGIDLYWRKIALDRVDQEKKILFKTYAIRRDVIKPPMFVNVSLLELGT